MLVDVTVNSPSEMVNVKREMKYNKNAKKIKKLATHSYQYSF